MYQTNQFVNCINKELSVPLQASQGRWPGGDSQDTLALRSYVEEQMSSLQQLQADLDERITQLNELQVRHRTATRSACVRSCRALTRPRPDHHC